MKKHLFILLILVLALFSCSQGGKTDTVSTDGQTETTDAGGSAVELIVKFAIGNTTKRSAGVDTALKTGEKLHQSDIIITAPKASVDILYNDEGVIRIAENSEFAIASLSSGEMGTTKMDLNTGKVFVSVSKLKKGGLEIHTQTMVAAVRGTAFLVDASDDKSTLRVVKGSVKVNPVENTEPLAEKEIFAEEGQQVVMQQKDISSYADGTKDMETEEIKRSDALEIESFISDLSPAAFPELNEEAVKELQQEVPAKVERMIQSVSVVPRDDDDRSVDGGESREERAARLRREAEECDRLRREEQRRLEDEAKDNAVSIPSF